ncbi:hypothetical protein M1615_01660 [Patescibacteria group bacterium]|nr:hypothetical protein [Patescibacteria group bacterium]
MKRKPVQTISHLSKSNKKGEFSHLLSYRYIIVALSTLVIAVLGIVLYKTSHSAYVLGTSTYLADRGDSAGSENSVSNDSHSSDQEKPDKIEPTDTPEPTDIPEVHQQVEKVQQELNKQTENNNLQSVEVQPPQEGSNSGKVILNQQGKITQEFQTPPSSATPVTQITTAQAGTVSVHIQGPNEITINNGPYAITTQYPVVINPTDQTMAIKTPSGVTVIKTFPTQVFQSLPAQNRLSSVSSVNLTEQQGTPVYQAQGIQIRKFLGIIPVKAAVQEKINAQTGQVVSAKLPWYYSLFGFAFKST